MTIATAGRYRTPALSLLCLWTLSATLWRTHRLPNDYAEAQWLLTWRFGFVKRGLPGTVLDALTRTLGLDITPQLLAALAIAIFGCFCLAVLGIGARILYRSESQPAALVVMLAALASPFFVLQMDVIGYHDTLVLLAGMGAALLLLRGAPWLAAALLVIALLVHEQSLVLAYPTVAFATLLLQRREPSGRILWQHWVALVLPLVAAGLLAVAWQHTTTPEVVAAYAGRLRTAGFISDGREVWAPQWLFRSFADSFAAESPYFIRRMEDVGLVRLVLPSVLSMFCLMVEGFGVRLFSIETLGFAAVCLAPQAMHLVAWDTPRIWTYSTATSLLALWVCTELRERQRGPWFATRVVAAWTLLLHVFTRTPLLDVANEGWDPFTRTVVYAAPVAVALTFAARRDTPAASSDVSGADRLGMIRPGMGGDVTSRTDGSTFRFGVSFGFLLFVLVVLRTAWLGDDAYITFRSVDNLIHGYGFRWNVVERVQPFTHPLWALLLVVPMAVTGEAYFAPLLLSMGLAVAALWLFARHLSTSGRATLVALAVFVFSKAFVEYATSGLENPLTTLLLVLFLWNWFSDGPQRARDLWLVAGLILLNRLDAGLLVLPALAVLTSTQPLARTIRAGAIGLAPFLAWEAFSIVYFGFPFPNTAYAKLGTGIGGAELAAQGLLYMLDAAMVDPVTPLVVLAGLIAALAFRQRGTLPVALGIALYLAYIVRIGGDFMTGRFLVAPLVCATALLCRLDWNLLQPAVGPLVATLALLGTFATVRPPITSTKDTFARNDAEGMGIGQIADERAFYYRMSGLLRWSRETPLPADPLMVTEGIRLRNSGEVLATRNVGFFGYFAGPRVHIVDLMALGDPLLARLPAIRPWRIGHFERRIPEGYVESIRNGRNQIVDPDTAILYEDIRLVTQGPLWTRRRWRAIARLNGLW